MDEGFALADSDDEDIEDQAEIEATQRVREEVNNRQEERRAQRDVSPFGISLTIETQYL